MSNTDLFVAVMFQYASKNVNKPESVLKEHSEKTYAVYAYAKRGYENEFSSSQLRMALMFHNMDVNSGRVPMDDERLIYVYNPMDQLDIFLDAHNRGRNFVFFPTVEGEWCYTPTWFNVHHYLFGSYEQGNDTFYREWFDKMYDSYIGSMDADYVAKQGIAPKLSLV